MSDPKICANQRFISVLMNSVCSEVLFMRFYILSVSRVFYLYAALFFGAHYLKSHCYNCRSVFWRKLYYGRWIGIVYGNAVSRTYVHEPTWKTGRAPCVHYTLSTHDKLSINFLLFCPLLHVLRPKMRDADEFDVAHTFFIRSMQNLCFLHCSDWLKCGENETIKLIYINAHTHWLHWIRSVGCTKLKP